MSGAESPDQNGTTLEAAGQAASPGAPVTQIPDHQLIRKVGGGSYGEVWLARSALGTYRAVKIVHRRNFAHDRPFEREFNGIKKYEPISRAHAGLVDVLQVGRDDQAAYFYYVMELADDVGAERRLPNAGSLGDIGQAAGAERRSAGEEGRRADRAESEEPNGHSADIDSESYAPRTLAWELSQRGRLPFEECLSIGLTLSSALTELHKHGLVHRDVKPSNIIFVNGVAELADIGLVTDIAEARSYVGTEGFIPPEGPGTPQADIYSLGKVLYEMSTGKDRQEYPELPTNLGDTTKDHELIELNEIVLKSCRADPAKRYQKAEQLNADLLLLQRGRSIKQVRKLQKRLAFASRVGIAAVAVALLATGAWLGSIKQIQRAREAERKAKAETARSEALFTFLMEDLLLQGSPEQNAVSSNITVMAALDKAAAKVDSRFTNQLELAAAAHRALGQVYLSRDLQPQAEQHLQTAFDIYQRVLGPEHHNTLEVQDRLATLRQSQGRIAEAERLFRTNLTMRLRLLGPDNDDTLSSVRNLMVLVTEAERPAEALDLAQRYLPSFKRVYGEEDDRTLMVEAGMAICFQRLGKPDEALKVMERVYAPLRRVLGAEHPYFLSAANIYATVLQTKGRLEEAEQIFRNVLTARRSVQGDNHWNTLVAINNLAVCLGTEDNWEEALTCLNESADAMRVQFGPDDQRTLGQMSNKGHALLEVGRAPEAEELLKDTLERRRGIEGIAPQVLSDTMVYLGDALTQNGKPLEAERLLVHALQIRSAAAPASPRRIAEAKSTMGACLTALGRYGEAEILLLEAHSTFQTMPFVAPYLSRETKLRLLNLYRSWGRPEEAMRFQWQIFALVAL